MKIKIYSERGAKLEDSKLELQFESADEASIGDRLTKIYGVRPSFLEGLLFIPSKGTREIILPDYEVIDRLVESNLVENRTDAFDVMTILTMLNKKILTSKGELSFYAHQTYEKAPLLPLLELSIYYKIIHKYDINRGKDKKWK